MTVHLVPNLPPERENQLVMPKDGKNVQTGPEMNDEQKVTAKIEERPFRDGVIECEEARWNTPEKAQDTVEVEVQKMRDILERLDGDRIQHALDSRQKMGCTELKPPEDFVLFLQECGVEEEHLAVLKKACPVGREDGTPPSLKHFADTCIAQINKFLKPEHRFEKAVFIDAIVVDYADRRKRHFVQDQTAEIFYKDRNHLPNFYRSDKGVAFMKTEARKQLGLDQPPESLPLAA